MNIEIFIEIVFKVLISIVVLSLPIGVISSYAMDKRDSSYEFWETCFMASAYVIGVFIVFVFIGLFVLLLYAIWTM